MLEKVDKQVSSVDLTQRAIDAATEAIMCLKQTILDFCWDVVEMITAGESVIFAAYRSVRNVLVMTLRALRDGINAAVSMIKSCCTVCDSCIRVCGGVPFPKLVAECYNELVDVVENFFKSNL